ncbi:2-heptyl-3-hydroxy-4(1H)-quinolone synthase [Colletotrichum spaethianum]|uniref:2-heptyl-3-hydroxy-4(1H)-quinolone synthase n=1 Tax=Colletotrichum spaethianum TaxID=700344 RepID=A0AA37P8P9_9PEZI|nr:2-heptyl-3-hydroxy-4(1H)-quinolone synthase [Colletotrichum spaethianum]GKT47706.1 2-heptyl-3-hydroxy-4(1H)-quinolone synthase [Colletotrichum spaethianum]
MTIKSHFTPPPLKVAIIGGGPGGLGAAIEFAKLHYVDWTLYEKKPQISETGGGISLQQHTWRLLELNGAAKNIDPNDFFRSPDGTSGQQRNGRTGKLLQQSSHPKDTPPQQLSCRMVRAKLQAALLKDVDQSRVKTSKKLIDISILPSGRVEIRFEDGLTDEVDLLVGADGIRSIKYNGQSAYRTIISKSTVEEIDGIPKSPVFWQNTGGKYVFTCPLGGDDFEVTARIRRPIEGQEHVSWGRPFDFSTIASEYDEFCEPVRKVIQLAAQGKTEEFALFSGARLESVISHGALALIGDASHPLSGAFGAGAGFALEDVYALTRGIDWAQRNAKGLPAALELYDQIRSPHYRDLYGVLDNFAALNSALLAENLPVNEEIEERVKRAGESKSTWMYHYEIDTAVDQFLRAANRPGQVAAVL